MNIDEPSYFYLIAKGADNMSPLASKLKRDGTKFRNIQNCGVDI